MTMIFQSEENCPSFLAYPIIIGDIYKKPSLKTLANDSGHIVADTLLPTQMFPRLPARATLVADTNFVSGTQKMFLILFRNILCPKQMFPSLRSMETQHSFCVPRFCVSKKHHEQQSVRNKCVLVCQGPKAHS